MFGLQLRRSQHVILSSVVLAIGMVGCTSLLGTFEVGETSALLEGGTPNEAATGNDVVTPGNDGSSGGTDTGTCPNPAMTSCNGVCFTTANDVDHCGAACIKCENNDPHGGANACVNGKCEYQCKPTFDRCMDGTPLGCWDTSSDDKHCGKNCRICPGVQTCKLGVCTCPVGQVDCGGTCVDLAANPARFVDPINGVNDDVHGGIPSCAFKTLTYALTKATAMVVLPAGTTYQGDVNGETLPFQLQQEQGIKCGTNVTLKNSVVGVGYPGVVQFAGTHNVVDGCTIDHLNAGGYAVVFATGGVTLRHELKGSTVKNAGNLAVNVASGANNIIIQNNAFSFNNNGIFFVVTDHTGISLTNNTFTATGNFDVYCQDKPSPGITGSGNIKAGGGAITCSGCTNCFF